MTLFALTPLWLLLLTRKINKSKLLWLWDETSFSLWVFTGSETAHNEKRAGTYGVCAQTVAESIQSAARRRRGGFHRWTSESWERMTNPISLHLRNRRARSVNTLLGVWPREWETTDSDWLFSCTNIWTFLNQDAKYNFASQVIFSIFSIESKTKTTKQESVW